MKCKKCNESLTCIGGINSKFDAYACTNSECSNIESISKNYYDTSHHILVRGTYKNKQLEGLYISGCLLKCSEHLSLIDIYFLIDKNLNNLTLYNADEFFAKKRKLEFPEKFSEIPDKYLSHIN